MCIRDSWCTSSRFFEVLTLKMASRGEAETSGRVMKTYRHEELTRPRRYSPDSNNFNKRFIILHLFKSCTLLFRKSRIQLCTYAQTFLRYALRVQYRTHVTPNCVLWICNNDTISYVISVLFLWIQKSNFTSKRIMKYTAVSRETHSGGVWKSGGEPESLGNADLEGYIFQLFVVKAYTLSICFHA